ncbi:MAG TPA: lamin tail domain-containing protein, partial [Verrucomicrobiae bacterium]
MKSGLRRLGVLTFLARFLLPAVLALHLQASGQVIISEFLANNVSGLRDEHGNLSDWIEVFNTTNTTVNMDGWFLTDSAGNLTKWRFPATNLPPSGFLVVFADNTNQAILGLPLHAPFALSGGGEYLAL